MKKITKKNGQKRLKLKCMKSFKETFKEVLVILKERNKSL